MEVTTIEMKERKIEKGSLFNSCNLIPTSHHGGVNQPYL
jgi:hypothetical protein